MLTAPIMSRFDLFFILVDECNEVIDNAIAKKIVDLHSNNPVTIETVYEQEDILRYINFAKHFKPTINSDAAELLVENYTTLRQREGTGSGKSTWRVTVRQLESLIRLSEALAKLECADNVTITHVHEAKRLLSKSIVRVEQPDVDLDALNKNTGVEQMELDDAPPTMEALNRGSNITHAASSESENNQVDDIIEPTTKKFSMPYETYKSLTHMFILFMRNEEDRLERENKSGIRKSELVAWYLDQIQDQIDSEEELLERKELAEKFIDRLIYVDQIIISLTMGELGDKGEDDDPELAVHPNYIVDA